MAMMSADEQFGLRVAYPLSRRVENVRNGKTYTLISLHACSDPERAAMQIAAACSTPRIYRTLFADLFHGRSYEPADAEQFIAKAAEGWASQSFFVFALLDPDDAIVGALDIKSANAAGAEIGYWLDEAHSGVMSNAVAAIVAIARQSGFRELYARVAPENVRSRRVLDRAGLRREDEGTAGITPAFAAGSGRPSFLSYRIRLAYPNLRLVMERARAEDISLIAQMNQRLIEDERHPNPMTADRIEARMRGWLASEYQCYLARLQDQVVGYCLFREEELFFYVRHLYVERNRRLQGIATTMLDWLTLRCWGDKAIRLDVLVHNEDAVAFYRRYGFAIRQYGMERSGGWGSDSTLRSTTTRPQ